MYAMYGGEYPKDRARHYAAVACQRCRHLNSLTYKDGDFICTYCVDNLQPMFYYPPREEILALRHGFSDKTP